MIDATPPEPHRGDRYPFLDTLLRDALPEIKLALGELIDRENARALPSRYARLLPETTLVVTLRPDAAEALAPLASTLERELTESCNRHGSLYDRGYRVQLHRSGDADAPLYQVAGHAGHTAPSDAIPPAPATDGPRTEGPHADLPAVQADRGETTAAPDTADTAAALPLSDPDATRVDAGAGPPGWQPGRWVLVVEDEQGTEREVFRLIDPYTTVGRRTDDPQLSTTVALSEVPQVSRRQLALLWEERDGAPGWRIYNLGLNPVHLPGQDLPGAHIGRGSLHLEEIPEASTGWLPPGIPLRIGDHGPTLRVDEVPEESDEADPDATVHE